MSVTGSSLVNTSSNGQPTNNEDRPFSFALGTQIFLNPTDDPTDAVISFKANALKKPCSPSKTVLGP